MDEVLHVLEEHGYVEELLDQLLEDMKTYKEIPEEYRKVEKKWDLDDIVGFDCSIDGLKRVWEVIDTADQEYKMPCCIPSTITNGAVEGMGLIFKSTNGEIDMVVIYDDDSCDIGYNIKLKEAKDPEQKIEETA